MIEIQNSMWDPKDEDLGNSDLGDGTGRVLRNSFRPGLYRHFKGGLYMALFVSRREGGDRGQFGWDVTYIDAEDPRGGLFTRPIEDFLALGDGKGMIRDREDNATGQERRFAPYERPSEKGAEEPYCRDYVVGVPREWDGAPYVDVRNAFFSEESARLFLRRHPSRTQKAFERRFTPLPEEGE